MIVSPKVLFPTMKVLSILLVETMQWHYIKGINEMQLTAGFYYLIYISSSLSLITCFQHRFHILIWNMQMSLLKKMGHDT